MTREFWLDGPGFCVYFRGGMTTVNPTDTATQPLLVWLLKQFPDSPKKRAKQWITAGRVSVNGVIIRKPHQLLPDPGAALQLLDRQATTLDCGREGWQIHPRVNLLYLDAALAVVNKGPGLLAVPAAADDLAALTILADFLAGRLRAVDRGEEGRGHSLPPPYRRLQPQPVHRLDLYTSGVFCMAMNPVARQRLIDQLQTHKMRREYIAYVEGRPAQPKGTWRNWLKLTPDEFRQFVISDAEARQLNAAQTAAHRETPKFDNAPDESAAVEAITHYETMTEFALAGSSSVVTKLRLRLETGRKHQIRAQAAYAGLPLVGDRTYVARYQAHAPRPLRIRFERQALHAASLSLEHPDRPGVRLTWDAALAKDLFQLETMLRTGRV